ncbi:MAG TPA: hypothetical protein VF927_08295 [Solirubrobacteraceae bacterium]
MASVASARGVPRAPLALLALAAAAVPLAGCGGGVPATAGEPAHTFPVKVAVASFPAKQSVSTPERLRITVQNPGDRTIPNVAVTVDSFNYASNYAGLAANKRPVWAIEQGPGRPARPPVETQEVSTPGGGQTAYVNTWALGALSPRRQTTFVWHVVPLKSGSYTVHYSVAAGLAGKSKALLASGGPASGQFAVQIAGAPAITRVEPNGKVVTGAYPPSP